MYTKCQVNYKYQNCPFHSYYLVQNAPFIDVKGKAEGEREEVMWLASGKTGVKTPVYGA